MERQPPVHPADSVAELRNGIENYWPWRGNETLEWTWTRMKKSQGINKNNLPKSF